MRVKNRFPTRIPRLIHGTKKEGIEVADEEHMRGENGHGVRSLPERSEYRYGKSDRAPSEWLRSLP